VLKLVVLLLLPVLAAPAQVAVLQIQVIEGEGTVHTPGARNSRPLTVQITDETGKPVSGAAVTFHLPEDGPGGIFANALRTDVQTTDGRGRAAIRSFQANRISGPFQIRIVASKEQARAGTVSFQYIGESKGGAAAPASASAKASHQKRWLMLAAVAGGGAIGAAMAGRSGRSTTMTAPAPTVPAFGIGSPAISVGHP